MVRTQATIEIVHASIIDQDVDAVVNAANTGLTDGGGITGVIFKQAGQGLPCEIKQNYPHGTKTGTAVITGGHGLRQKYIIHTPGPVWHGGIDGEADLLESCYRSVLEVAEAQGLRSIAFCSISTGIYGYPLTKAAPLALRTVKYYLDRLPETSLERVVFALFGESEYQAFTKAWAELSGEDA